MKAFHGIHVASAKKHSCQRERGVILVVALVMLLVMTGVGVNVISDATLQERMAGNNRQLAIARLNAESALREAEQAIAALDISNSPNPVALIKSEFTSKNAYRVPFKIDGVESDPLSFKPSVAKEWRAAVKNESNKDNPSVISASATSTSDQPPRYVIEYIGRMAINEPGMEIDISDHKKGEVSSLPYAFRITAIGYGRDQKINAILQSIYSTADNP